MSQTYTLERFIQDVERITRAERSPSLIVDEVKPLLAQLLHNPNCLGPEYRKRCATEYGRYMLHRAPLFNITAIVWGPGDGVKAHNHNTWGLVGVVENEIQETRFRRLDDGSRAEYAKLEVKDVLKNSAGMVSNLVPPDDDIHEMNNRSNRNTVEIHVYGKDLTDMPRLRFDVANNSVKTFASPKYQNC